VEGALTRAGQACESEMTAEPESADWTVIADVAERVDPGASLGSPASRKSSLCSREPGVMSSR